MPPPTMTWAVHAPYPISAGGSFATIPELLAAIKGAVDAAAAGAGRFEVADYNAGVGTLVLRRKGSPDGELGTMRIVLFGGTTPHASALRGTAPAGSTQLYLATVVDPASATAPDAAYASGSPYPGKKYTRANTCGEDGTIPAAGNVVTFDAEDAWGFVVHGANKAYFGYAGKLIHRIADDALLWASFGSGAAYDNAAEADQTASATPFPIYGPFQSQGGSYWDGTTARYCGRLNNGISLAGIDPYSAADSVVLALVMLGDCAQISGQIPIFIGFLRQMRMGPKARHGAYLRDALGVLQARHISASEGTPGFGIWLDNVA